jgi:hypothetical protein
MRVLAEMSFAAIVKSRRARSPFPLESADLRIAEIKSQSGKRSHSFAIDPERPKAGKIAVIRKSLAQ